MTDKEKALRELIRLKEDVMRESQTQIRQAHSILENMERVYKKALEDKMYLQEKLIGEISNREREG